MKRRHAVIYLLYVVLFFCFLFYPWTETGASNQLPTEIPSAFLNQESPNQQPPCVCKSLKIAHGSVTPSVKIERDKKASVKVMVKKDQEEKELSLLDQYVEYYTITIQFFSELTLWCCPGPKKDKCSANVTAEANVMQLFSRSTLKLLDHEVSRYHKISEQLTEEGGAKLPLELSAGCGNYTKKKLRWKYDVRMERRLTAEEYEKEKIQKDEVKIKNMMKELDFGVDFIFVLSCQDGWKSSVVRVGINPDTRQWVAKLDKTIEVKTECPKSEAQKGPPHESPMIIPRYYPPSECTVPLYINVLDGATMQPLVNLPLELSETDGTVVERFYTGVDGKAIVYLPQGDYLVRAAVPLFGFDIPAYASPTLSLAPDRPYNLNIILYTLIPVKYVPIAIYSLCALLGILIIYRIVRIFV